MKKLLAFACLLGLLVGCYSSSVAPDQSVKATLLGVIPVPLGGVCYAVQLQIGERRYGTDPSDFPSIIPYTVPGTTVYVTYHANTTCAQFSGASDYIITLTSVHL